jgi:hypothetical protein
VTFGLGFLVRLAVLGRSARPVPVRNPLGDLLVPLLLALAIQQADDSHGHVVTTDTTSLAVGSQAVIHHVLTDSVEILLGRNASSDEFDHRLRRLAIPDA